MPQGAAHIATEAEYFHRIEAELIEQMRHRAAEEEELRRMAEASHIEDFQILETLEKLGYTHSTVILLHLVPLVEMAWIDGSVSSTERDQILAIARERGVARNTPAYQQLVAWLGQRPSPEFFQGSWRAIHAEFELLPSNERAASKGVLARSCKEFAYSSCERSSWASRICTAKRNLLKEILWRLARR